MSSDPQRVQAVFLELADKPATERITLLEHACNGDHELRRRIDALLKAHDGATDFLDSPPPGIDVGEICPVVEQPGDVIGPYKLVEQIGEGGFGVVFLAEQERPVRRRVALKIIKPGMDTRQVIARFEAERQALALMDHSYIAKVFDAGATATGRPYFVMELVQGAPITTYCDNCNLTTPERLELFVAVCHAVQHAHQKGVIHRDIKPTNVLVTMQDGRPAPKIIDFGVAKALDQKLTEHTHVTALAQMIGTPLYMSPEQAELSSMGVDTRSDIYSLGVLLYELLTGTTPFDQDRLRAASYDELRRILREEEPPTPSARLSTLAAERVTTIAEQHRTDARRLVHTIRGELDWIALKCLEKDRNRRYETVDGLARDIERYLHDEPVTACPPSVIYRFRKFSRRNKAALLVASTAAVTLLVLVTGLAVSNRLIAAARGRAETQQRIATEKAAAEQRATTLALAEAAKANAVVTFLQDMLSAAHPDSAGGNDYTVRQLVDQFAVGLDDRLADQPEVEATVRQIIGSVYTRLRLTDQAEPQLRRSLELHRQVFGENHVKYADSLRHLAWNKLETDRTSSEVEDLARQALAVYRKNADPNGELHALWLLILSLDGQEKLEQAEAAANEALALARAKSLHEHSALPNILHQLAWINIRKGDYPAAERLARESVEKHLHVHGDSHPETAFGWTYLGASLHRQGKFNEAEECYRKSLDVFRRSLPENHSFIRPTLEDLIWALRSQGKYEEAINYSREAIRLQPDNAAAYNHLAWLLSTCPEKQLNDPAEALELATKAVELDTLNPSFLHTLGVAQYRMGNWQESIVALRKSREVRNGGDSYEWFFTAMSEWQLGNHAAARKWYQKALDWMDAHDPNSEELIRFRAEAEELINRAGND
jgi:serine/threonine protein kinase/tetratricopeptide (TPR) repeat protein